MRRVWRVSWREQPDSAPVHVPEPEHYDSRDEAEARGEEVMRTRRVVGEVFIYELGEVA